jgi:hypothetical protein
MFDPVISEKPASWLVRKAANFVLWYGALTIAVATHFRHGARAEDDIGAGVVIAFIGLILRGWALLVRDDEDTRRRKALDQQVGAGARALRERLGLREAERPVPARHWGRGGEILKAMRNQAPQA